MSFLGTRAGRRMTTTSLAPAHGEPPRASSSAADHQGRNDHAARVPAFTVNGGLMSVADAADFFRVSKWWVRKHLHEFPNRVRLPGGDIRIPVADAQALVERCRMTR